MIQLRAVALGLLAGFLASNAMAHGRPQQLLNQQVAIQRVLGDKQFEESQPEVYEWLTRLFNQHKRDDGRHEPIIEDNLNHLEAFLRVKNRDTSAVLNAIKHAAFVCRVPDRSECDLALTSVIVLTGHIFGAPHGPVTPKRHFH